MGKTSQKRLGIIFITIFVLLIISGIIAKRVFHAPDLMMVFHLPAAVFLILGGKKIMSSNYEKYLRPND